MSSSLTATSIALLLSATLAKAQDQFVQGGGGGGGGGYHGGGYYHYNGTGVFLFWFFFLIIVLVVLFGCVGGVYTWGGHSHQVTIGRIVDRNTDDEVTNTRTIEQRTTTIADDDGYGGYGDRHQHRGNAARDPMSFSPAQSALPGGTLPISGSSALGLSRLGGLGAKKKPLKLVL